MLGLTPEFLSAMASVGGWVFATAAIAAVLWLVVTSRLVPGSLYRQEVDRGNLATGQNERQVEAMKVLTEAFNELAREVRWAGRSPGPSTGPPK